MTWAEIVPAVAAALVLLTGPGLIATAPLRLGAIARVALSGLVSVVCLGAGAALGGVAGWAWHPWQALVIALPLAALAVVARRVVPRGTLSATRARPGVLAGAWIGGAVVICLVALSGVASPERISQTYDNVFHLSAVSAILDGFSGSPLTLRSLIETGGTGLAYYPSGWHLIVAGTAQLSGASVPAAFHAAWIAVAIGAWMPGAAWLTQVVVPAAARGVAVPAALALSSAFGAFPYALLSWGTIYPTYLAHALLPAAVAIMVAAIRLGGTARAPRAGVVVAALASAALVAVLALGISHPRVIPTWVVIGAPFVVAQVARAARRAWRAGGRLRAVAVRALVGTGVATVAALGAAFAYAVVGLGLFDEPISDRLSGPQAAAVQGVGDGVLQVILQAPMTGDGAAVAAPSLLLAALVAAGAVAAWRARRAWLVVAFVLVAALFVLAAGSDGVIAKLATGVWYKDRFRLAAAIPAVAVPLAAWGALVWGRIAARALGRRGEVRPVAAVAVAVAAMTTVVSAVVLAQTGSSAAIARVFWQPDERADAAVISRAQEDFFATEVRANVPADQRVLGDPWDGSALTGLYADREPVFPHVNGQWDADRLALAWHLEEIGDNPDVCRALDALRVRYVLYDPHEFGGGDPSGNHFPGPHRAVEAGLFERVATDGVTELYRIDQCGDLPAG
ncbi:DUF6541 family protein [Microbacterium excoecariae]|uniref:DUF6541 family protein n=1 Tax=Microbacterium excoecariae TaxID=2715210 RepID=UPI001407530A|nr:DUF6541 family protein [Microbacterium excoecariae]NHI17472.1 hypothetical protein [Microbacterium excoecariae]